MDLTVENDNLKREIKDLEDANKILRRQIDEIYKCWLYDSAKYTKRIEQLEEEKIKLKS